MENLKGKTFKALAWNLGSKFINQGLGFFLSVILTRLLSPREFGLVAMAAVFISLAQVFIDSGLNVALIQRKDVRDVHFGSVFSFNITIGLVLTITFFLLAGEITNFYKTPELKAIIQILSFNFLINSFARVQSAWLRKQLKFDVLAKAEIVSLIVGGSIGVTLAFLGYGVWALVAQSILNNISRNITISILAKWQPKLMFRRGALKELWGFGFRMFLSSLINTIATQMDNLIIGKLFLPMTLGYYHRAKSFNQFIVNYTSGSLNAVLFPALSNIKDEESKYNRLVQKSYQILNLATFFLTGVLLVISKDIIIILFSEKWLPSVFYFRLLLIGGFGVPISSILVNIISSKGNSKAFLKLQLVKQFLFILNLIIGFQFGIVGYLYGLIFIKTNALVLNIIYAAKEIKFSIWYFINISMKYILVTAFSSISVYFLIKYLLDRSHLLNILFAVTIYAIIYIFLLFIFKIEGIQLFLHEIKHLWVKIIRRKKLQ